MEPRGPLAWTPSWPASCRRPARGSTRSFSTTTPTGHWTIRGRSGRNLELQPARDRRCVSTESRLARRQALGCRCRDPRRARPGAVEPALRRADPGRPHSPRKQSDRSWRPVDRAGGARLARRAISPDGGRLPVHPHREFRRAAIRQHESGVLHRGPRVLVFLVPDGRSRIQRQPHLPIQLGEQANGLPVGQ